MNNETHSRPAQGSLATMMASGSLAAATHEHKAGEFASKRKGGPKWLSEPEFHSKLESGHQNLSELGYKWKSSSMGKNSKGVVSHVYTHKLASHGGSAVINERANGKHSIDFKDKTGNIRMTQQTDSM